jgi:hypothetical protein
VRLGPDAVNASEVPRDHLRPVQPVDDLLASGVDETNHIVQSGGGAANPATATMIVPGYLNEAVDFIELTYQASSSRWNSLKVDLETPGGIRVNLADPGNLPSSERFVQITIPANAAGALATLLGGASAGGWKLHMYDVIGGGGGGGTTFESARITLHTHGGPDRVARSSTWISAPLDVTTRVLGIDGITWTERLPAAATVSVSYRACAQAACSDDPKWSGPVVNGAAGDVAPQRYLQLKVEMTSNGTLEPELRGLAVAYRRAM